ncbi:DUF4381 domain-containing protein [Vibrio splendidus]|uniref:DUF4381 domain-containing protein n=1 Tax=Vibrio splendidus TaxID=29497 RepID=UPI000D3D0AFB|nr:DUF4381 domain-containing protein [Vibrio splendidus]PTO63620.1 DUF4381 domain-containing protein [Vibrio splendidus]PTO71373.1 DUF4381 domain-containing protein [Vibrio splendidus]PTP28616.1 DUF4381 domain-containing protein [Vibrio splendidus]PTP46031.1 DUF4381 domain-containing protein [Vibrio splendidus]PTP51976.1 DUF4381 domain-containing protein [Vibrio splendidus]
MTTNTGLEPLQPENVNPLMASLSEPSLPESISWLPNAPGWYWLLLLLFCFALYRVYLVIQKYLANTYRRAALVELEQLSLEAQSGDISSFQKLPQLLRRTALYAFPRAEVAPITGTDWEKWLDDHCTKRQFSTEFSTSELSGVLAQLAYSSAATLTGEKRNAIMENVALWIKHHEVSHD